MLSSSCLNLPSAPFWPPGGAVWKHLDQESGRRGWSAEALPPLRECDGVRVLEQPEQEASVSDLQRTRLGFCPPEPSETVHLLSVKVRLKD